MIFDQLVIIGAAVNCGLDAPHAAILVVFPATPLLLGADEYGQITSFCFPHGFRGTPEREFLFDQFVFQITSAACQSPVYGLCTVVWMTDCPDAIFHGPASKGYPTCFCRQRP